MVEVRVMADMETAQALLAWASAQNPGPWVGHSEVVARAAREIANACGLDAEHACTLGMLHDIGRYRGPSDMMHVMDGYRLLAERGFQAAAQICVTHSFPTRDFEEYSGADDCDEESRGVIKGILLNAQYTDYDRLIQLCDGIALPTGICLMEKRLVDVVLRHGANYRTAQKWQALFGILEDFQSRIGAPFYSLFPEAVRNTFAI